MSTNAKPVARAPTPPPAPAPETEAVTAESLGWQLRSALPPMRLHSVSLYNNDADVLWLSEGALGPDEHNVVVEAIEYLKAEKGQLYHELGMGDGRIAIFLGIRGPRADLLGTVMLLADMKSLSEGAMERVLTVPVKTLMQKMAVFLRKLYPQASDTSQVVPVLSMSMAAEAKPAVIPTAAPAAARHQAAPAEPLAPKQVDAILTLDLADEPPPAGKPKAEKPNGAAPAPAAAKPAPVVKAVPKKAPPTPAGSGAATATAPAGDIEVLDFDAELTMAPTRVSAAKAAPAVKPPAAAPAPVVSKAPAAPAAPAIAVGKPAAPKAPVAPAATAAAPPAAASPSPPAPAAKTPPAPKPATPAKSSASVATVSVPVLNISPTQRVPAVDDDVLLINDTGKMKKLDESSHETMTIAPALPITPPPPPLTAEETATDLTLFVQELIKLRSSGRTRRYEVLARSRRHADRNEVPTAFLAETARGREGAALDALVVERLMQWLGQHGETIWDSEPASFSVNLSIGALEDETFVAKIAKWLEQYNVPAEYVGFEISEFACMQCRPAVQRFIGACEKLGCFLVIDNFSFDSNMFEFLGSKSLRHVKIDPELTCAAMKEKLPQALVVAILQACKVLGVHCVAKRIESQSSLQWLTAVGCDFAQSFHLEKPTAIDTLASGKSIKALRE